ncbi:MAG: energy transducer TonB [Erythrobacter sp.]|jgi:hypothetical protein|nr:energy transducer TonB [Erythrobacter sp.]
MKHDFLKGAAVAAFLASGSLAAAQDADRAEDLPEAVAEGEKVEEAYEVGRGNDNGTTTIKRKEIEARTPGSGDVNQLLKLLPTVQFNRNEGLANREDIQDIRPADISIAGGRIYENLITVDGIDVGSRLDVTNDNPFNFNEPAGNAAQGLWLDAELIGEITLRDSNVSAEFGRFTGGALNIETREARRSWAVSGNFNYTEDGLTNYLLSDASRAAFEASGEPLPEAPEFRRMRFGASIDVPLSDKGGLLFAVNRSRADVLYFRSAAYDFEPGFRSSVSDNFLVSGNYDLAPDLKLSGQLTYSPYESEAANANGIDNLIVSNGGGVGARLRLESTGDIRWDVTATYNHSDTSRTAPPANFSIPSTTTNGAVCSNTNCTIGGFGSLDQTQDIYGLNARIALDIGTGELRGGLDLQRVEAFRERPDTNFAFQLAARGANIVCPDGDDLTCATGEYALTQRQVYRAYTANIGLDAVGAWAEYSLSLGEVDLRAGLRYDYESFLGNHNFAPRLAATWNIDSDWQLTFGANRYYGRSMLAYAIREQYPPSITERRSGVLVNGERQFTEDQWNLFRLTVPTSFQNSNLDTPFSDELTAGVSAPLLGGVVRLRGIARWGKDEFSRSLRQDEQIVLETGATATRRFFTLTNDGESNYRGISLEWVKTIGKHTFALNANYSETQTTNEDFFLTAEDVEEEGEQVLFNGEVIDLLTLLEQNQRLEFAAPLLINASWTGLWLNDRLTTNLNLRYRSGFDRIEDTGVNEVVDGTRFDVYDFVRYDDQINVDLNLQYEVLRTQIGALTLDARISNLLNTIPAPNSAAVAQPFQFGRSTWLGLRYRF